VYINPADNEVIHNLSISQLRMEIYGRLYIDTMAKRKRTKGETSIYKAYR
jgi:hypothetical protein